jgi:hypothetical protein
MGKMKTRDGMSLGDGICGGNVVAAPLDDRSAFAHYEGAVAVDANTGRPCQDKGTCNNRFIPNAIEIVGDLLGDEDGLCEANEVCLLAPDLGSVSGALSAGSQAACTSAELGSTIMQLTNTCGEP